MLRCVSRYRSSLGAFQVGDVITAPELCAALLNDSPASFALEAGEPEPQAQAAALEDAPENRAVMKPRGRKQA